MKDTIVYKSIVKEKTKIIIYTIFYILYTIAITMMSQDIGKGFDVALAGDINLLRQYIIRMIIIIISVFLLYYIQSRLKSGLSYSVISNTRNSMFKSIIDKPVKDILSKDLSFYQTQLSNEINILEGQFFKPLNSLFTQTIGLIITLYTLFKTNILITVFILAVSLVPILLPKLFTKKLQIEMGMYSQSMEAYNITIQETLDGYEEFKLYGVSEEILRKHRKDNKKFTRQREKALNLINQVSNMANSAALFVVLGSLILGMFLALNGKITIGQVFAISFLSGNILGPLASISSDLPTLISSKELIKKYPIVKIEKKKELIKSPDNIVIENLGVSFDKPVLSDFSAKIEKGKKYAFIGESGSGKSTVIKSLLGYYNNEGNIIYDGMEQCELELDSFYNLVSYIPQKTSFFTGSIRDNILFFDDQKKDIGEDDLKEIIRITELDNVLKGKSKKLETQILGVMKDFSGGEKERISLARAMARNNDYYILDEATSALDKETHRKVEDRLLSLDATILSVTHRLDKELLERYDKIFVLDKGKLVEEGHYKDLMDNKNYLYRLIKAEENRS